MDRGRGRNMSRGMLPLLALHAVNEYYHLPWKPPVTAGLLAANTLVYLRPAFLHPFIPSIDEVWFNPHLILKYRDLKRFFLSPFYHVGESHLVYNMMSLLWKGIQLETAMGSVEFASMVAALLAMSQGITMMLSKSLLLFFDYDKPFYSEYAVGFSGVLFALKVVLYARSDDYAFVHGLRVPARHAAWAELILIQMFVPGVSFLGHLGGILAGILYLKLKRSYSGTDPVAFVLRCVFGVLSWPMRLVKDFFRPRRRISGRGRATPEVWRCPACTYDNSGWLSECEMCGNSRGGSGVLSRSESAFGRSNELSLEEIRRRRIERFGR